MGSFLAFCTKDKFVLHWLLYISVYFCVVVVFGFMCFCFHDVQEILSDP